MTFRMQLVDIVMEIAKVFFCSFLYFRSLYLCIRPVKLAACYLSCVVRIQKVFRLLPFCMLRKTNRSSLISDKAMAMGIIQFAIGLFGNVPCPIIYGVVIDSTCLIWETICGKAGACSLYDIDAFRHFFLGE